MKYLIFFICLLPAHLLLGQVTLASDTAKFKVSNTFWAKNNRQYVDSIEMDLLKTYLDLDNIVQALIFTENHESLHNSKQVALITRKEKVDFIGFIDLMKSLNLEDSINVKFYIDGDFIPDTSGILFEPLAVKEIEIVKNLSIKVDNGFDNNIHIMVTTKWRGKKDKNLIEASNHITGFLRYF